MRKTFLYPAVRMLKKGNWNWIVHQGSKFLILKYLRKIIPNIIFYGPVMGVIVVTYRCNSNCPMCDLKRRSKLHKELTTSEFKKIIDELVRIKTSGISFTGGEPLLRKDIFELIAYANSKGLVTTLNTNALLLNSRNLHLLLSVKPDNINISLDSASSALYDRLRGTKNGLKKLNNLMKKITTQIKEQHLPITLTSVTTVGKTNISELTDIARLAQKMGFHKIGFNPLHNINQKVIPSIWKNIESSSSIFQKIKKIRMTIDNSTGYLTMFDNAHAGKPFPIPCLSGYSSLFIDCYGDIYFCWPHVELNNKITNWKKQKITAYWSSGKHQKNIMLYRECRDCYWNCQAEISILFK